MWSYLSRAYLDLQELRIACQARLRKMREQGVPDEVCTLMENYYLTLKDEEEYLLGRITERLKSHPLYKWTSRVKGMGPVITFHPSHTDDLAMRKMARSVLWFSFIISSLITVVLC